MPRPETTSPAAPTRGASRRVPHPVREHAEHTERARRLTVSVVIPVLDDAENLQRCLDALARQTLAPDEIVVVDNGSRDDSAGVARRSGARVVRELRPGIPAASAGGYDAATRDVIARLDADCVPTPTWIAELAATLTAHPEVTAVTGPARFHDGPRALRRVGARLYLFAYFGSLTPALGHVPLFGSNFALRRDAWLQVRDDVHRTDTELHDDLDLSFHLGAPWILRFDPAMEMPISARPFTDGRALVRRFRRGFHTVARHWPHELPWLRWRRLVRAHRARRARSLAAAGPSRLPTTAA